MASVGAIKERTGVVYCATRRQALALFQRFGSSTLGITEIEPVDFCAAALLMDGPWPLRGVTPSTWRSQSGCPRTWRPSTVASQTLHRAAAYPCFQWANRRGQRG